MSFTYWIKVSQSEEKQIQLQSLFQVCPHCHRRGCRQGRGWRGSGGGAGAGTGWPHSLNFHSWRHMGQCCCTCCALSHLRMQCMWKQWEHWPHTRGQSSPGTLPAGGGREDQQVIRSRGPGPKDVKHLRQTAARGARVHSLTPCVSGKTETRSVSTRSAACPPTAPPCPATGA